MTGGRTVWVTGARDMRELPYDPAPGDVAGVRALAARLEVAADDVDRAGRDAVRVAPVDWEDEAARAAWQRAHDLAATCAWLQGSFRVAVGALRRWAARLADLQAEADALDREAATAAAQLRVHDRAGPPGAGLGATAEVAWYAERERLLARRQAAVDRAGVLHQGYAAEARAAAADVDAAHGRDRPWDRVHDLSAAAVRPVARWAGLHADLTGVVGGGLGAAGLVTQNPGLVIAGAAAGASSALQHGALAAAGATSPDAFLTAAGDAAVAALAAVLGAAGPVGRAAGIVLDVYSTGRTARSGHAMAGRDAGDGSAQPGRTTTVDAADGREVTVRRHEVTHPWHSGAGVRGHGYAPTATVPVRVAAPPPGRVPHPGELREHLLRRARDPRLVTVPTAPFSTPQQPPDRPPHEPVEPHGPHEPHEPVPHRPGR